MQESIEKDIIGELIGKISRNIRICFLSGIITSFFVHGFMLANKLPNWDDLLEVRGYGGGGMFGRWLASTVHPLGSEWSVPWLNGSIFLLFLSVSACLIYAVLQLETISSAIVLPMLIIAFPSVCASMSFMFMADMYGMSIFFICLGVYFVNRYRWGWLAGIILTALSLGLYQSYICLEAAIFITILVLSLLRGKDKKQILFEGIKDGLVMIVSMLLYMVIAKWRVPDMSDYNGYDTMGKIEIAELPKNILKTYRYVWNYFIADPMSFVSDSSAVATVICCALIVLILFGFVWYNIKNKKQTVGFYILLATLSLLFPLAMGGIYILAPRAHMSMLMLFQYVMVFVLLLALGELAVSPKYGFVSGKIKTTILAVSVLVFVTIVNFENYTLTNEAYFRMDIAFTRANNFYNRILMHLEEEEEYQYGDKVALVGYVPEWFGTGNDINDEKFADLSGITNERGISSQNLRGSFLRTYMGVRLPDLGWEFEKQYWEMEEYQEMPAYPHSGCIKKINDVWVIKLE